MPHRLNASPPKPEAATSAPKPELELAFEINGDWILLVNWIVVVFARLSEDDA